MNRTEAVIAAHRFGLGARPGQLDEIAQDPRGWLESQLDRVVAPPRTLAGLSSSGEAIKAFTQMRDADEEGREMARVTAREHYRAEVAARMETGAQTTKPFRERWVRFWTNHFTVSVTRNEVRSLAGAYEREAIRPRAMGRFGELLFSAERHPAMQLYLDNVRSIGPDSPAGQRSGRGLNENHAREILELHTLGVQGGYTQTDVEALAAMLTGWGLARGRKNDLPGGFVFDRVRHQPGSKKFLGQTFSEAGENEGRRALEVLATHPSTAQFIARKLATHFVADQPPVELVHRLTQTFVDTRGDLRALARTLIEDDSLWRRTRAKLRTPAELVTATARALNYRDGAPMLRSVTYLGQIPFAAPSPQGWSDLAGDWLGPEAMVQRVEWAQTVGKQAADRVPDARELAHELFGPMLSQRTDEALKQTTGAEALSLLLASPEFQRR